MEIPIRLFKRTAGGIFSMRNSRTFIFVIILTMLAICLEKQICAAANWQIFASVYFRYHDPMSYGPLTVPAGSISDNLTAYLEAIDNDNDSIPLYDVVTVSPSVSGWSGPGLYTGTDVLSGFGTPGQHTRNYTFDDNPTQIPPYYNDSSVGITATTNVVKPEAIQGPSTWYCIETIELSASPNIADVTTGQFSGMLHWYYRPVGSTGNFSVLYSGTDNGVSICGFTESALPANNIGPGVYEVRVRADDNSWPGSSLTLVPDAQYWTYAETKEVTIKIPEVKVIDGPKEWFRTDCPTLTATTDPVGGEGHVKWYYQNKNEVITGDNYHALSSITDTQNHKSKCTINGLQPGDYQIYVRTEHSNGVNGQWAMYPIKILDIPPTCPVPDSTTPGGSGCTSCGGANSTSPSSKDIKVYRAHECGHPEGEYTYYWQCKTCQCGYVSFPQVPTDPHTPIPDDITLPLGDNTTITRHGAHDSPTWTYTIADDAGNISEFSAASFGANDNVASAKITSETDADGNVTTYSYDTAGNLTKVETKSADGTTQQSTDYSTTTDSATNKKTVSVTEADGTATKTEYSGTGWTTDKPLSVKMYDSAQNVLSDTTYTYDDFGRVSSEDVNGKFTTYTYTIDANYKITSKTETLTSASPNIVTVYGYNTTNDTVTRKHPTDSTKDQVSKATYFMTSSGTKRTPYVFTTTNPVTANPAENVTTYSTYVESGTTATGAVEGDPALLDGDYIVLDSAFTADQKANLLGKVYKITDPEGRATTYHYDKDTGNLSSVTYPDNSTETYTYYSGTSFTKTVKNTDGNYTHYVRDTENMNRVLAIMVDSTDHTDWSAILNITIKEYDYYTTADPNSDGVKEGAVGLLWKERVPNVDGAEKIYEYWETVGGVEKLRSGPTRTYYQYWDISAQPDPAYVQKCDTTHYDEMGRVLSTTDAINGTISYTYDAKGRQIKSIYASGVETESNYDCCTLTWTMDERGKKTHYAYDDAKRVTDTWTDIQSTGNTTTTPLVHYTYDCFGNMATVTTRSDASTTRVTWYTYDNMNRVKKIHYHSIPLDSAHPWAEDFSDDPTAATLGDEAFLYSESGNLVAKKDGNNAVTLYRYDVSRRLTNVYYNYTGSLTTIVYPTTANVSYTYDGVSSRRASMTDSSGTSYYDYDIQGRLTSYTPNSHAAVTYTYNNLGQKTGISSTNYNVTYDYYANGWLKDVKKGTQTIASYTYDEVGNRTKVTFGNGTYQTFVYATDPRYMLSDINYAYRCGDGLAITENGTLSTGRDGAGNPEGWTVTAPGASPYERTYAYDANSRLITETYPGPVTISNDYDWVGNKTNLPGSAYNAADQLTSRTGHTYTYDAAGNMAYDNSIHYTYTPSNLLTTAGSSSMAWDGAGNRVSFTKPTDQSNPYTFIYDVTAGIPAIIEETHNGSSVYYVREPSGALIARIAGDQTRYYHFDDLGSTMFLTGNAGTITDKYIYDAWGNVTSHSGGTSQPYQYVGRKGYYTHYQDANFSLLQLGVRFYDPSMGRFTQRDPLTTWLSQGLAKECTYNYASNAPVIKIDPSGFYAIKGDCSKLDIPWMITSLLVALKCTDCWDAIESIGAADFFNKMRDPNKNPLEGITIYCHELPQPNVGQCPSSNMIELSDSANPRVLIHELVHASAWNAGQKPDMSKPYQCDYGCGRSWKKADPEWEKRAEKVSHACFSNIP